MKILLSSTIALVLAALAMVSGCGRDTDPILVLPASPAESLPLKGATGYDDPELHQVFEAMWTNTDGVLMQVFRTTIECSAGGTYAARPLGWPDGHEVILEVEPGTVPLNRPDPVDFEIHVPVTGPLGAATVPYEFQPHGIRFSKPIHITLVWPDWAGPPAGDQVGLLYLEQEFHDGDIHYRVADRRDGGIVAGSANRARYSIDHFSRWYMADGDTTRAGDADDAMIEPLQRAVAGSTCWNELTHDPDVQISAQ